MYVYVCFIFIAFFQFGFERQRTYVCRRISPWQRSGVIGERNGAEMICGRWLDHGLSMMTSLPPSPSTPGVLAGGCSGERGVAARYFEGWR